MAPIDLSSPIILFRSNIRTISAMIILTIATIIITETIIIILKSKIDIQLNIFSFFDKTEDAFKSLSIK